MKVLVALLFLLAVAFASKWKITPEETVEFIEGVAVGLEVELGNVTECTKDLNITLEDFEQGFADVRRGIDSISLSLVEKGIMEWGDGLKELVVVLKVCGADEAAADIEKIILQIESGPEGIVRLIAKEILNILDENVGSLFREAVDDWEDKDYFGSGKATGKILGILIKD
eukprot:TRINITY_DN299_c0_g1_i1.p1 TRINITY_DN299_c0_g1~~TRINITY_DN299_c0_g1_i1.p1  ORF type:complete len:171 (-),score=47.30 TRINITY_DN299_c0_g1_i1:31-543(-)